MFFKLSSAFVLAAASFCVNAATAAPDCAYHHVVNPGDSCKSIAYHTGTTVDDILACNSWITSDCSNVVGGDDVKYPSTGLHTPNWTCGGSSYTVQDGDTCESIATHWGVELASLYFCNPINVGCANIYAGQSLSIIF